MDSINILVKNIIILLVILFILPFVLPPFILFKFVTYVLKSDSPENVAGKVVLITGASSGIGEQLAYEYAKKGACLVLASRRRDKLERAAIKARKLGSPEVIFEVAYISKVENCKRFIDTAVNHFGKVDHLVNNAGILQVPMLEDITNIESVASIMDINFWGSVYCTRFALPYLRKTIGKIAVISSSAAWLPVPRFSIYSASKIFFETLRTEIGPEIGITIAYPGWVDSEMTRSETVKEGKMDSVPKQPTEECARAIFSSICRGERYLLKLLLPELLDVVHRKLLITNPSALENITKKH